jgi:putative ABC transport system ATP-binding protein
VTTATDTQPGPAPAPASQTTTAIAARAVDVVKTYGRGEAAVRALDSAGVAIPAGYAELTAGH